MPLTLSQNGHWSVPVCCSASQQWVRHEPEVHCASIAQSRPGMRRVVVVVVVAVVVVTVVVVDVVVSVVEDAVVDVVDVDVAVSVVVVWVVVVIVVVVDVVTVVAVVVVLDAAAVAVIITNPGPAICAKFCAAWSFSAVLHPIELGRLSPGKLPWPTCQGQSSCVG